MKSAIVSLLIFLLLIILIVGNAIYVSHVCKDISNLAQEVSNSDQKEISIAKMKDLWSGHRDWLDLSVKLNEIERMSDLIESLDAAHKADNQAEISKYCILISELAEEFSEHEKLSFRSIC